VGTKIDAKNKLSPIEKQLIARLPTSEDSFSALLEGPSSSFLFSLAVLLLMATAGMQVTRHRAGYGRNEINSDFPQSCIQRSHSLSVT